jgi:glycosyltransferase involved in cell wall biosynthesis
MRFLEPSHEFFCRLKIPVRVAYISYEYSPETSGGGIGTYIDQAATVMATRGHDIEVFSASPHRIGSFERSGIRANLVQDVNRASFRDTIVPVFAQRHHAAAFDVVESPEYLADGRGVQLAYPNLPHVVKMHTPNRLLRDLTNTRPRLSGYVRHNVSQARIFLGAIRRGGKPGPYESYQARRNKVEIAESFETECVRSCSLVVSPSEALRTWVVKEWAVPLDRTMVVPNPYVRKIKEATAERTNASPVVGYFGRLERRKGIEDLVEAIPLILDAEPETRFRIVGDALYHQGTFERYDRFVKRHLRKHAASIDLVGARPAGDMEKEYSQVNICVFPSIWENFPNVCLEAMAAGRAIVASSAGGMAEMLEGGKHGLLVPPRNPKAIAEAVIKLIRSPDLCNGFAASARRRVMEDYSAEKIAPLIEQSFATAISTTRRFSESSTRSAK